MAGSNAFKLLIMLHLNRDKRNKVRLNLKDKKPLSPSMKKYFINYCRLRIKQKQRKGKRKTQIDIQKSQRRGIYFKYYCLTIRQKKKEIK